MGRLDLWKCDSCGKEYRGSEGGTIQLVTENSATATYSETTDLCCRCLSHMIHDMATQLNPIMRAEIMSRYTKRKGE